MNRTTNGHAGWIPPGSPRASGPSAIALRGHFLVSLVALQVGLGITDAAPARESKPGRIVLEAGQAAIEVDPQRGVFTCLRDPASALKLEAAPGMAENFRLTLLKPDNTTAIILGRDQPLSSFHLDRTRLSLRWDGPLRDTSGTNHDLSVRMEVAAVGGSLEFRLHCDNRTAGKVQEAWYPLVGGLTRFGLPGQPADATLWLPTSTPTVKPLQHPFAAAAFGYPGQLCMSFCAIQSKGADRCLYLSSQDSVGRYKTYRLTESKGPDGAKDFFACIQHSPLTPSGGVFDGPPVAWRFLPGDWRAAGRAYREWFQNAFGIVQPSQCWIRGESFFLMTMFMLPEGTINLTFRDIPAWARAARDHGLHAVQISGWQVGGHDNGYPDYTIDPRLGTWKELEDGIRACHQMGLKVYFFVNYQPVMLESEWYRKELHQYREMTANGGLTWNAGWGMGTLWARMDHPKRMTWADPAFPQFRKIIVDQFARLAGDRRGRGARGQDVPRRAGL